MNLEDSMSVARDRARKAAKSKSRKISRTAKKAAKHTSAGHMRAHQRATSTVPRESGLTLGKKLAAKRAKTISEPVSVVGARPVKVTVKQAVLDGFYSDQRKVLSTKDAVAAIQASHPGMNESSIRVWISDFRKDGSVKLVKKQGREVFLMAGKLGKFALR
jgi:hypothetical protein